ncbi:hypothetical protein GIB67_041074 [Kingdonia uniflora]|uniref:Uncharacterized protein n=1 Tax=Kingdonia uniflora TaxID=39325 RepID=A0A7J7LK13_9MAGN|nr:hypothetical protein GIB67_041074 [Kingdonia uniflora]
MDPIPSCHVVAMPYPGRGHINPMMNLCKLLALDTNVLVTFIVTEEWLGFISSTQKPSNLHFRSVPNVIPSELGRAADLLGFMEAVFTKMEVPVEELMDQLEGPPVRVIIADTFNPWAVKVGIKRKIPVASLWTMSPSVFTMFYHLDLLTENKHFPVDLAERGNEIVKYIPGISSVCLTDLPTIYSGQKVLNRVLESFDWARKSQGIMFTCCYDLDTEVIDALRALLPFPVYPVGPLIPHTDLAETPSNAPNYMQWLDSQPRKSVLYVSLGSFLSVSSEQLEEIVAGVRSSGVRYLWVARGDTSRVQEACGEMGLVVSWCDQLRVLSYPSIGGFWTHCGWNSTMEGAFAGVPMLTLPILFDQVPNAKQIVDDWKIGVRVKESGSEVVVKREDIAMTVQRFMDLDGDGSKQMRRRASELKETCRLALANGGSSASTLNAFVREILQSHC